MSLNPGFPNLVVGCSGDSAGGFEATSTPYGASGIVRNGAGDYTVTHSACDPRNSLRLAVPVSAVFTAATVNPLSPTTTQVLTWDAAAGALDKDFQFMVFQLTPGY